MMVPLGKGHKDEENKGIQGTPLAKDERALQR